MGVSQRLTSKISPGVSNSFSKASFGTLYCKHKSIEAQGVRKKMKGLVIPMIGYGWCAKAVSVPE